ncbi:MAG: DUF5516 domain-containing protein [Trichodesmium sp.]
MSVLHILGICCISWGMTDLARIVKDFNPWLIA